MLNLFAAGLAGFALGLAASWALICWLLFPPEFFDG
jgi:hypothetical protein